MREYLRAASRHRTQTSGHIAESNVAGTADARPFRRSPERLRVPDRRAQLAPLKLNKRGKGRIPPVLLRPLARDVPLFPAGGATSTLRERQGSHRSHRRNPWPGARSLRAAGHALPKPHVVRSSCGDEVRPPPAAVTTRSAERIPVSSRTSSKTLLRARVRCSRHFQELRDRASLACPSGLLVPGSRGRRRSRNRRLLVRDQGQVK